MLDVDYFKEFSGSAGLQMGGIVLRQLGDLLSRRVRGEDIVCRYGGDEFALVLTGASLGVVRQRAEKLREELKTLKAPNGKPVSFSAGVAAFPLHGPTKQELLRAVELALCSAKIEGRDRVVAAQNPSDVLTGDGGTDLFSNNP